MARSWKTCSRRSASARRHGQDTAELTTVGAQRDLAGSTLETLWCKPVDQSWWFHLKWKHFS